MVKDYPIEAFLTENQTEVIYLEELYITIEIK